MIGAEKNELTLLHSVLIKKNGDLLIVILQCSLECPKYADCELVKKEKAFMRDLLYNKNRTNFGFKRYVELHVICSKHLSGSA